MSEKFRLPKHILLKCDHNTTTDKLIENYYHYYYDLVREKNIQTVLEIGVRAGYSMYAMASANLKLDYTGIDLNHGTHGGIVGAINHAKGLAKDFPEANISITEGNSEHYKVEKFYDLIHIDGDHSYRGCMADLEKFTLHGKYIFIDDYDYIGQVKKAVDEFIGKYDLQYKYIPSHTNLRSKKY